MSETADSDAIGSLLARAVELPVEDRVGFVEAAEVADVVRREVVSLLAVFERAAEQSESLRPDLAAAILGGDPGAEPADPELRDHERRLAGPYRLLRELGRGGMGVVDPTGGAWERFAPGEMVAGRFRIVAPLGRGGMGEVYRADDLRLGQQVALKFLPVEATDEAAVGRLREEVRLGRQVSHPNVCRLYDLGEWRGTQFVSMEYIDGEDLASLLRRIGRVAPSKALDVARDVCAGLAAIHGAGLVHRDLKPANVMIDGRGTARITDFGLAATGLELTERRGLEGTPAYMAPEQLAQGRATQRTDLYALGLLLFEVYTGRRRFEGRSLAEVRARRESTSAETPSQATRDLDPEMRRVILRCLEPEPDRRPPSIDAVIAALPGGGDPLQAALDAGETPSPERVAAAGITGELAPPVAAGLLALGVGLLLAATWLLSETKIYGTIDLPLHVRVLEHQARAMLAVTGADAEPADEAADFVTDEDFLAWIREHPAAGDPSALRPPPLLYSYRSSPVELVPLRGWQGDRRVIDGDPPYTVPGMTQVLLDPQGKLVRLLVVPGAAEDAGGAPARAPVAADVPWETLLAAAGFEPAGLREVAPRHPAPVDTDVKRAWEGVYPQQPEVPLQIVAGSFGGELVWFEVVPPWRQTREFVRDRPRRAERVQEVIVTLLIAASLAGGVLLARRNLRRGRGDRRGALRLGVAVFALHAAATLLRADHLRSVPDEWALIVAKTGVALFLACVMALLYLALEPYLRRSWPRILISWNRLIAGRWRDPLVGRDLLAGTVAALLVQIVLQGAELLPGGDHPIAVRVALSALGDLRQALAVTLSAFSAAILPTFVFGLMLLVLHRLLRRRGLALGGLVLVLWGLDAAAGATAAEAGFLLVVAVIAVWTLVRHGIVGVFPLVAVPNVLSALPLTLDTTAWFFTAGLVGLVWVLAMLAYGFGISAHGRPRHLPGFV